MGKHIHFADAIRAIGAILILLCHYTEQSSNVWMQMTAQFFNIGVPIFIILSGFLFGLQRDIKNIFLWYKKRVKRIYIPFELFVLILAIVTISRKGNIFTIDWLLLVLGLQGSEVGVFGAEQTWFISPLLLCYLLTPFISAVVHKIVLKKMYTFAYFFICFMFPIFFSLVPQSYFYVLFAPICWYSLAYYIGYCFDARILTKRNMFFAFIIMFISFALRILSRLLFDGTIWYDRIAVTYTQAIAAFCIFFIIAYIFNKKQSGSAISFISKISFEIYLYHYMFCVGPVKLFGITGIWALDCVLVTMVTIIIAYFMNRCSSLIIASMNKKSI